VRNLRERGVEVSIVRADVGSAEDVGRLGAEIRAGDHPLRGVFHLAMVIDDAPASALRATGWDAVANWREDNPQLAWSAFIGSCGALKNQPAWQSVCSVATALQEPTREVVVRFFETNFTPYQVINADGTDQKCLIPHKAFEESPRWSPDGSLLAP
jgi:membrane-bound lytic murein transglycosylase